VHPRKLRREPRLKVLNWEYLRTEAFIKAQSRVGVAILVFGMAPWIFDFREQSDWPHRRSPAGQRCFQ